ncbi:MAG: type II toxin-antitoxin system RelE/ParE family toxin [Hyphomicrobiaceae bacterium]
MRVFATKEFARFARKERIGSSQLCETVLRAGSGLIDADLGGGVIKQRVARQGQGRSGGYRTIIAFRSGDRSIFMYGFAKNSKANLSDDELEVYRRLAQAFLQANAATLQRLVAAGELKEVECDDQEGA